MGRIIIIYLCFFQIFMFGIAGEKMTERIRSLMFRHMLRQEIGFFDRKENGVGALCTNLSKEASSIQGVSIIISHSGLTPKKTRRRTIVVTSYSLPSI